MTNDMYCMDGTNPQGHGDSFSDTQYVIRNTYMAKASLPPYYETREFQATLRGESLRYFSKPGLPAWDRVTRATALLAEAVELSTSAHALVLGCRRGELGAVLGCQHPDASIVLADTHVVALDLAALTIAANSVPNVVVDRDFLLQPRAGEQFDVVAMELPAGRKTARRWLAYAHAALKPGGALYLAGPNHEGIQPVIDDGRALCGSATILGYKDKNRIARAVKERGMPAPDWSREAGIAPGTWHAWDTEARGNTFHLHSLPGVFAFDKLDAGTALLLDQLNVPAGAYVLDIGCGYGIIGMLAARLGAAQVDMVDANLLAVASARENVSGNAIAHCDVYASDATSAVAGKRYDLIVTNPPFHAGKAVEYDMAHVFIEDAQRLLAPGGQFMLVANSFIRYDRLLAARFKQVDVRADNGRFQVLVAR